MKKVALTLLLLCGVAAAQPVPSGHLNKVVHTGEFIGNGNNPSPLGLNPCGSPGETWIWSGTVWACGSTGGVTGTGTADTFAMWTGTGTLGNSPLVYNGTDTVTGPRVYVVSSSAANPVFQATQSGATPNTWWMGSVIGSTTWFLGNDNGATTALIALYTGDVTAQHAFAVNGNTTLGDATTDTTTVNGTASIIAGATTTGVPIAGSVASFEQVDGTPDYLTFRGTAAKGIVFNNATQQADGYVLYDQTSRSVTIGASGSIRATFGTTASLGTALDLSSNQIHNVADPTSAQDAVTVNYLAAHNGFTKCSITPSPSSGSINNMPITAGCSYFEVGITGTSTLSGIDSTGVADGQAIYLHFTIGQTITIAHESSNSTTTNRIRLIGSANNLIQNSASSAGALEMCVYDAGITRWECENIGGGRFSSLTSDGSVQFASASNTGTSTYNGVSLFQFNSVGQTVDRTEVTLNNTSTYNTTSAARNAYGFNATCTNSISAGTNTLTSVCGYFTNPSSGTNIVPYALETGDGDVNLNTLSGNLITHGNSTLGDALTDITSINGDFLVNTDDLSVNHTTHQVYVGSELTASTLTSRGSSTLGAASTDVTKVAGRLEVNTSTASISTCGTSVVLHNGNANSGYVTTGTSASTCTINLGATFTNAPNCTVSEVATSGTTDTSLYVSSTSTTQLSFHYAGVAEGVMYVCVGR